MYRETLKVATGTALFIALIGYLLMWTAPIISPILHYKFLGLLVHLLSFGMMGVGMFFLTASLGKGYLKAFLLAGIPVALLGAFIIFPALLRAGVFSPFHYSGVHEGPWESIAFYFYTSILYGTMFYGALSLVGYRLLRWVKSTRSL